MPQTSWAKLRTFPVLDIVISGEVVGTNHASLPSAASQAARGRKCATMQRPGGQPMGGAQPLLIESSDASRYGFMTSLSLT